MPGPGDFEERTSSQKTCFIQTFFKGFFWWGIIKMKRQVKIVWWKITAVYPCFRAEPAPHLWRNLIPEPLSTQYWKEKQTINLMSLVFSLFFLFSNLFSPYYHAFLSLFLVFCHYLCFFFGSFLFINICHIIFQITMKTSL